MRRKMLSIFLIGAVVLQGIPLAHSHTRSGASEPSGHGQRPHIHLSGHQHEHNSSDQPSHTHRGHSHPHKHQHPHHNEPATENSMPQRHSDPAGHHDDDAVYVANPQFTVGPVRQAPDLTVYSTGLFEVADASPNLSSVGQHTWAPPRYSQRVPVFLRTAKLLI